MAAPLTEQIRGSLEASRRRADLILGEAELRAAELSRQAAATDRARGAARLSRLDELRREIADHQLRIEQAYVSMAEAMAAASLRLAEVAREADFSPPQWPAGIERTLELKLCETREVTFRLATGSAARSGDRERSGIAVTERRAPE